jgi:hypothetical protein
MGVLHSCTGVVLFVQIACTYIMLYVFLFGFAILMVEERLALDQHENIYYPVSHIQRNRFIHELPSIF